MDIGAVLREARLQAGLSCEEVSQRTKIQLAKIEALEANAFERLPEGIYLNGLIRAYATEVGLDGNELVAGMQRDYIDDFASEADDALDDATDYIVPPQPRPTHLATEVADTALRRDIVLLPDQSSRRGVGRFVLPMLAFVGSVALGAYLYDRGRPFEEREGSGAPGVPSAPGAPGAPGPQGAPGALGAPGAGAAGAGTAGASTAGAGPADGAADAANARAAKAGAAGGPDGSDTSTASRPSGTDATGVSRNAQTASPDAIRAARMTRSPAAGASDSAAAGAVDRPEPPGARDAPGAAAPSAPGAPGAPGAAGAPSAPDLSGPWALNTRVEVSSVSDFEGLQLGYRLELRQQGSRITGQGLKTLENGRTIVETAQTPIVVQGTIDGNRLTLTFTERGALRESAGKMILEVHEDGVMRGRFSSSAARSTGIAEARRPEG